jgi:hypothetical protein
MSSSANFLPVWHCRVNPSMMLLCCKQQGEEGTAKRRFTAVYLYVLLTVVIRSATVACTSQVLLTCA